MLLAAVGAAAALSVPNPYDIYARARARWAAQRYPRFLAYDVKISGNSGNALVTNTYASTADTQSGEINVRATSAEEAANPYVPHGADFKVKLKVTYSRRTQLDHPSAGGDVQISKTVRVTQREQFDLLGVPMLSPEYSFGLSSDRAVATPSTPLPAPGLKTIAAVTAVRRDYDIRYDGIDTVDGAACYHLQLTPDREPSRYRLRQLWIDAQTFAPRQAAVQGNFTAGPGPQLPWLIHFAMAGDLTYIQDESAMTPVKYLGRTYSNVTIAFENVQPRDRLGSLWTLSMFRTSGDVLTEP
jgi:hypothetical protein